MKMFWLFFIISITHSQTVVYFNGDNAMHYLNKQCEIGPRYPGSSGHKEAIQFYYNHFNKYSDNVELFSDYVIHPHSLDSIKLTNIFSRFNPDFNQRLLLMAHFDTREYADKDLDKENQKNQL